MGVWPLRERICILSYSYIRQDARVRRQIEYLLPNYDVTVIGFGDVDPKWTGVTWHELNLTLTPAEKWARNLAQVIGRLLPPVYDLYHRARPIYRQTMALLLESDADAFHANDLSALPVCAEAARRLGAKLIFDAHEYAPLEQETPKFKRLETPYRTYLLRRYAGAADASITVCSPIAQRYAKEFGFHPIVIMNAPTPTVPPDHPVDPGRIRLVHHGVFQPERGLDRMVKAVALANPRYELHFFLTGDSVQISRFRQQSETIAPERVFFHDAVPVRELVPRLAEFDIGFAVIVPSSYNLRMMLPNKFFDFVMAGLAIITGPSPAMVELAVQYGFGKAASAFEPEDVAEVLEALSVEEIIAMRQAARTARNSLQADVEMRKLTDLYQQLLDG